MMMDFSKLYRRYAQDVYRFALFLCGSAEWAEDLTSETFVRVWTTRDSIQVPTVKAYLLVIARNLYLQQVRKERRYVELNEQLPDRALGPEVSAQQREEMVVVLHGLQTLSEADRTVLIMRALYDMPYEEIAAALGLSISAARVRVHRARLKLIQFCDQET